MRNVLENVVFSDSCNIVKATVYHLPIFLSPCPQNTLPLPTKLKHLSVFTTSSCRLKIIGWNVCTGLEGLRKKQRFPDHKEVQYCLSGLDIHKGAETQSLTYASLTSWVSLVPVLIIGYGIREWKYFKLCRKGLWSLSNSSQYGMGKNLLELFLHEQRIVSSSPLCNFRLWVSNTYKHTFMVLNCKVWVGTTSEEYFSIPIWIFE